MAIELNAYEQEKFKYWIHDILIWGGAISASKAKRTEYKFMYNSNDPDGKQAARIICDAIKFRVVDYKRIVEVDDACKKIANFPFLVGFEKGKATFLNQGEAAKYIAYLCQIHNYLWNDLAISSYEREEIFNFTILGEYLQQAGVFESQVHPEEVQPEVEEEQDEELPVEEQPEVVEEPTIQQTNTTAKKAPSNNYKSTGPHSGDIPNLIGNPGQKLFVNSSNVYVIDANKIGNPKILTAFINPLKAPGTGFTKVSKSEAEAVRIGACNIYTNCRCILETKQEAEAFLQNVINKWNQNGYENFIISSIKPNKNGYFKVSTDCGECLIPTSPLNEELEEQIEEQNKSDKKVKYTNSMEINLDNVDLYTEALYHEM